ncbi:MAG: TonB-dependent receptor plug domain-containing protein [Methylotenera sp.]|uniref:TonB-dependent receptor n=1 Tax=Methylotenera sp. TaxID=2051956 RepID=UPI00271E6ED5|nr:TonB-dependent receptor plug domain-containing protein [Methylotenera sp.]MDO9149836.1 TonB-dependent receptor plug domain-containing protein [Methylotenera sp.]
MKQFALKKKTIIHAILTPSVFVPSVLTSCLLGISPMVAYAEHLDLPSVDVVAEKLANEPADSVNTSDTASLLVNEPGVSLYRAGGVSSLPVIHGLADDRIRIKVDGMDLISSCANHMNPALSYIDPANVAAIEVLAGVTPVSMGGDSIAGTIKVDSESPEFAEPGHGLLVDGKINTFYRSNNAARGVNISASVANDQAYMRYTGSTVEANNYKAGGKFKPAGQSATLRGWLSGDEVGSTAYVSRNHALAFGLRHENHLLEFKLGLQDIPYQGFVNQRMDMTGNDAEQYNLSYKGKYGWGKLEARAYHERTRHSMQFGDDKRYWYGAGLNVPGMPMDTEGKTTGLALKGDVVLSSRDTLRVGTEIQRYRLDDYWNAAPPSMMMSPNTFWNINNGQRDRYDIFAEWDAAWSNVWFSQLGLRHSTVKMDAGSVQGYNVGMYGAAAAAFNAADRSETDHNIDITAITRFTPDAGKTFEVGYAMKTRSPNVYERFAWSNSNTMVMNMVNWVGDGNGYVGNLDLKPEQAHTVSATGNWHDAAQKDWNLKVTPYFTYVDNYIDAVTCDKVGKVCPTTRADGFVNLSLDNQSARLYGVDISGKKLLASGDGYGSFTATGLLSYVRGKNRTTGDDLYNIMPLNAKLSIQHQLGGWSNSIQAKIVDSKDNVQAVRKELKTAGYTLFNLYTSYDWKHARLDLGVENIFDKFYFDPLGGAYLGQGSTMSSGNAATGAQQYGLQVPGMGRSVNVGLTLKY